MAGPAHVAGVRVLQHLLLGCSNISMETSWQDGHVTLSIGKSLSFPFPVLASSREKGEGSCSRWGARCPRMHCYG